MYIEKLEDVPNSYQFLLRPRKFGKSLFVHMLHYYYGVEHKEVFNDLFGEYYIGKNPTALANSFYVLKFDFSGISSKKEDSVINSFRTSILGSIEEFVGKYQLLSHQDLDEIKNEIEPADVLVSLFRKLSATKSPDIMILIDEYDHFTNELLSFNIGLFKTSVSQNGFVRKFFEVIKTFTGTGLVKRLFATGVTPVTLDSMTSGFNIAKNLTLSTGFNEVMGFTEQEVQSILSYYEIENTERVLNDMRTYYNGSKFSPDAETKLYNSNLVWYFLSEYFENKRYPQTLIDPNVASDYSKISKIVELGESIGMAEQMIEIIETGKATVKLTLQYSFEKDFTKSDLVSLLFYNGLLTIKESVMSAITFSIPNYAIRELYWEYFAALYEKRNKIPFGEITFLNLVFQFANTSDAKYLVTALEEIAKSLSNRDLENFREKDLKLLLIMVLSAASIFVIESEPEIAGGYADLVLTGKPAFNVQTNFVIELKYLQIKQSGEKELKLKEAKEQAERYANQLNRNVPYQPIAIVFVGREGEC